MPFDLLSALPRWLLVGLGLGVVFALVVVGVFLVGQRLFPTDDRAAPNDGVDDSRRRAEIRRYLAAIDERFREDVDVHGRRIEFYLPERDVAITFDARAFFHLERAGTDAVLVEHEMPGAHLGARLPFETPRLEPDRDGEAGVEAAFAVLGLRSDASAEAVRSAYRERVKEVHPDQGGDEESFRRIKEAYATARRHAAQSRSATS